MSTGKYEPYTHVFSFIQTFPVPVTSLISLGIEHRTDEYYYDNRLRQMDAYLFQYTLKGEGILEIEGESHTLKENEGFFIRIPSNTRYYAPKKSKEGWTLLYILIEGGQMEEYYNRTVEKSGLIFKLPIDAPIITYLFDKIEQVRTGFVTDFSTASSIAFEFMNRAYFSLGTEQPSYSSRMQRVINEIHNHFYNFEGSSDLATFFHLSENHFIREFKDAIGITPAKYLSNLKMEHAKKLLLTSNMPIEQISEACGYHRPNYFCRIFKKNTGLTPLTYRHQKG